jgi:hypothetical protein
VLVPGLLGPLPGASIVRWKAYAVMANAAAGAAVFALCLTLGFDRTLRVLRRRLLRRSGSDRSYTLHDVYSSDPLMYFLGPVPHEQLMNGRVALAGMVGAVGVLAKEFAAAPLYLMTWCLAVERRWSEALAYSSQPTPSSSSGC